MKRELFGSSYSSNKSSIMIFYLLPIIGSAILSTYPVDCESTALYIISRSDIYFCLFIDFLAIISCHYYSLFALLRDTHSRSIESCSSSICSSLSCSRLAHRIPRSDRSPRLEIRPTGEEQTIQAGKSFVFNCMGSGDDVRLFSDLTWYDPRGEVILS